jgi:cardiolipin synthase
MSKIRKTTHQLELVYSGEDYFSRLEQILKCQYEIHLQFYIFKNDATGSSIVNLKKLQLVMLGLHPVGWLWLLFIPKK